MEKTICNICDTPGTFEQSFDLAEVHSNVRRFSREIFTVWRCTNCNSLHSKESVDLDYYYSYYPKIERGDVKLSMSDEVTIQPFEKPIYNNRKRTFTKHGFRETANILDYGCNRGSFVTYLRQQGYHNAYGYDPYHSCYQDEAILKKTFDVISLQDVVEHVEDPKVVLLSLVEQIAANGLLIIGTPNADEIDLKNANSTANFELHQPYHRQIFSEHALIDLCVGMGLRVVDVRRRWSVDTRIPFINGSFLANYVLTKGNVVDSIVSEPVVFKSVVLSPKLMMYGLLGYYLRRRGNMEVVFVKPCSPE